jgi:hypothetical protein
MSEAYRLPHALTAVDVWPPDDTEESVVGTDLHQMTIINLRWGLNEIAGALTSPGQPAPWQALSQTELRRLVQQLRQHQHESPGDCR